MRNIAATLALGLVLAALFLFAASGALRQRLISRLGLLYNAVQQSPEENLKPTVVVLAERNIPEKFIPVPQLPPQRPLPPSIKIVGQPPAPASRAEQQPPSSSTAEPLARLVRARRPAAQEQAGEQPAPPPSLESEKKQAYEILLAERRNLAELARNSNPELEFKRWEVLKVEGDNFWIDVVFLDKKSGREVHYVWQVNSYTREVRPLSHEARSLAANR